MKYRCQSALKLLELDCMFHIFTQSKCQTVLDLAAAPGGFAQVALHQMRAAHRQEVLTTSTSCSSSVQTDPGKSYPPETINSAIDCGHSGDAARRRYAAENVNQEANKPNVHAHDSDKTGATHTHRSARLSRKFLSKANRGVVIAVDLRPIAPMPGLVTLRCNVLDHARVMQQTGEVLHRLSHVRSTPRRASLPHSPAQVQTQDTMHTRDRLHNLNDHEYDDEDDDFIMQSSPPLQRGVDVVLHDGVSVTRDQNNFSVTYAQNQMALSALQLACKTFTLFSHVPTSSHPRVLKKINDRTEHHERVFITKVLHSIHLDQVVQATRCFFNRVHVHKPNASRVDSLETYIVAQDFLHSRWQHYQRYGERESIRYFTAQSYRDGGGNHGSRRGVNQRAPDSMKPGNVFCMPPSPADSPRGRLLVWRCLGCDQPRMGCAPCPACSLAC